MNPCQMNWKMLRELTVSGSDERISQYCESPFYYRLNISDALTAGNTFHHGCNMFFSRVLKYQ